MKGQNTTIARARERFVPSPSHPPFLSPPLHSCISVCPPISCAHASKPATPSRLATMITRAASLSNTSTLLPSQRTHFTEMSRMRTPALMAYRPPPPADQSLAPPPPPKSMRMYRGLKRMLCIRQRERRGGHGGEGEGDTLIDTDEDVEAKHTPPRPGKRTHK